MITVEDVPTDIQHPS